MNPESVLTSLHWRYAVKQFDASRKIAPELWEVLEQCLVLAPSSYGLQPWRFIVVENPEIRAHLRAASWNQSQVTEASHYVVIASRSEVTSEDVMRHLKRIAEVQGVSVESLARYQSVVMGDLVTGPRAAKAEAWAQRQSYIAMGFVLFAAAELRIDSCPMEGLDPGRYDEILGLKGSGYATVAGVALGYRHPDDKYALAKKVRFATTDLIRRIR